MIEVRKHKRRTVRNINGDEVRQEYYYTVAKRFLWIFWRNMKFYPGENPRLLSSIHYRRNIEPPMVVQITEAECVPFTFQFATESTKFDSEADAIRVKLDIIQHPDKYIKAI